MGSEVDLKTERVTHEQAEADLNEAIDRLKQSIPDGPYQRLAVGLGEAAIVMSAALSEAVNLNNGQPVGSEDGSTLADKVVVQLFFETSLDTIAALDKCVYREEIAASAKELSSAMSLLADIFGEEETSDADNQ